MNCFDHKTLYFLTTQFILYAAVIVFPSEWFSTSRDVYFCISDGICNSPPNVARCLHLHSIFLFACNFQFKLLVVMCDFC